MCRVDFLDACFCPCQNAECPRVRPREDHLFRVGQIPWRYHIVRGATWEKTLELDSLPCNAFWSLPGAPEAVGTFGQGDNGMWMLAIMNCPQLRPRILEGADLIVGPLCEHCKAHCPQTEEATTPTAGTADKKQ